MKTRFILAVLPLALAACNSSDSTPNVVGVVEQPTPGEPGEPAEPVTPTEPSEPVTPVAPVTPVNPSAPGEPAEPVTPTEPSEPVNPPTSGEPVAQTDSLISPVLAVDPADPFFVQLENGLRADAPTNLRIDLVSNQWSQLNWTPARDAVAYNIYRSDGVVFNLTADAPQQMSNAFSTTTFNSRFFDCGGCAQPQPGDVYSYQVTAVQSNGTETAPSNAVTVQYHTTTGAAVPDFNDFYQFDRFTQTTNLTNTSNFIDQFELVGGDEFNGTTLDDTVWNTQLLWGPETIINGEEQLFVSDASDIDYQPFVFNGEALTIRAIPTPDGTQLPSVCSDNDRSCDYLSGALSSHDNLGITYGYVEARIKPSDKTGALSSFYLFNRYPGTGTNFHSPEIDILEYLGENQFGDDHAFQVYHYSDAGKFAATGDKSGHRSPSMSVSDEFTDDFHTFGVLWEPQLVVWYIDGREVHRITGPQVSRQQMNVVLYLVAGSEWTPDVTTNPDDFPFELTVDWIRVYQRGEYVSNGLHP